MGCLFLLIAALSPRLPLILTWIFTPGSIVLRGRSSGRFSASSSSDHHAALCDPVEYGWIWGRGMGVDLRILGVFADLASYGGSRYGWRDPRARAY